MSRSGQVLRVSGSIAWLAAAGCTADAPSTADLDEFASSGLDGVGLEPADPFGDGQERFDLPQADPDGVVGPRCGDVDAAIRPGEATITLLLDQSGTMEQNLGGAGTPRWDAVYQTLLAPQGVVSGFESDLRFGMSLYTNADAAAGCPDMVTVAPENMSRAQMAAAYEQAEPLGDTPTGESLLAVGDALEAMTEGGAKAVILATDGEPDTCACPNACAGASKGVAIEAAQSLYDRGIAVFVIAVGDSITDLAHLQHLANVGTGRARYLDDPGQDEWSDDWVDEPNPTDPAPLFTANDPAALEQAFASLVSGFVPCEFKIQGELQLLDGACAVGEVQLDGVDLRCPTDWELVDPTTMRLLGDSCATIRDGQPHDVRARFPCEVVVEG